MKKLLLFVLLFPILSFAQDRTITYQAVETDNNVSSMIKRWADKDNKTVYWDIDADYGIANYISFNKESGLTESLSFRSAILKTFDYIKAYENLSSHSTQFNSLNICWYTKGEVIAVIRPSFIPCDK